MEPGLESTDQPPGNESTATDVWVIEDDLDYQRLVVSFLDRIPEINCSFVSTRCEPALDRLRKGSRPDVILMDISLQGEMDGIEGTWEFKEIDADLHVLALTNNDDDRAVSSMIMAGASGYLLKPSSRTEIANSIQEVQQGGAPMTPSIANIMMRLYREHVRPRPPFVHNYNLSPRELEILQFLARGHTKKKWRSLPALVNTQSTRTYGVSTGSSKYATDLLQSSKLSMRASLP